ncbi:MAG: restriction endonuclease subunit S [Pseudonocardiaceae bacterium]
MPERRSLLLGEVIRVKHGYAFPGGGFTDDPAQPTLVTPGNFAIGGGFKVARPKTFSGDYPDEYVLAPGDLIVTMTDLSKEGATLGLPAIVPSDTIYLHNQRIGLVEVKDPSEVDPNFLHYYLRTDGYRAHVLGTSTGSTVRHTSPSKIYSYKADLPDFEGQLAIAEILGALDEKIAANVKLVGTAAELAATEFAAAVHGIDFSEKTFADIATVRGGGTPRTGVDEYWDGDIAWATPTDVTALVAPYLETTAKRITCSGLDACASSLYPIGSILMTSRATIGAFAVTQQPTAVNQGFIVVNPHDSDLNWWIYHEMRSRVDEFVSLANGATFLELSRGNFKKFRVRLADSHIMKDFGARADVLHSRARGALMENSVLAVMRDVLLPQLMSGKIRVKDVERTVEEVL